MGVILAVALVAVACGGDPDATTDPPPGTDDPATEPAVEGIGAEMAADCGGDAQEWQALIDAALAEGAVAITGPPDPNMSENLPRAFEERFGIPMVYSGGGGTLVAEIEIERDNDVYTKDAMLIGANSIYARVHPAGWLDDLRAALIAPVLDGDAWTTGEVPFKDPDGNSILQIAQSIIPHFTINTDLVDSDALGWEDLLDPRWQGQIISVDPSSGSGTQFNVVIQLLETFGEQYVRDLYEGQGVTLTSDARMAAESVARGEYAIGIGIDQQAAGVAGLVEDGLPIDAINATDALPLVSGGWALMGLLTEAPHPNAGQLFANWMVCPEGNQVWIDTAETESLLVGVESSLTQPAYTDVELTQPWWDVYDWDRVTGPIAGEVQAIFPR